MAAFHVACPITCRRICYCTIGFPQKLQGEKAKDEFLEEIARIDVFIQDPWLLRVREGTTVQVAVPKVVAPPPPAVPVSVGDGADADELLSVRTKRAAMQKKAAAASLVAEDYARRMESGDAGAIVKNIRGEDQGQSNVKVMCRLCFNGENEGNERARKMLPCKSCGKKYHRSCLKSWAQQRDIFHWSSWTCPSCRICEVCRKTGDPNKFMFCKRCDGAYHCYCQQPPHKNVGNGPYLCPKHTKCHSCGSTVPGNGLSLRWFLGYTCCDACGRLFVKGNYCPVCLKVYRDSESTPMVCCDICQRWVHCHCDGISDEKYLQFQVDGNLQYKCASCRGECYQVRDLEDAVQELWRRRDSDDKDLISSLRAAAGLPTQEEIFSISPFSDDEDVDPITSKNEYGRSLKFSLKGLVDKSPKKSKEYGKKSSSKKYGKKKEYQTSLISKMETHQNFEGPSDAQSNGYSTGDNKDEDISSHRSGGNMYPYPAAGSLTEGVCSINQVDVMKHKLIDEVTRSIENRKLRMVQLKSNRPHNLREDIGEHATKAKSTKGPKLVIHLGSRNRNVTSSPRSDGSSCQREQDLTPSNEKMDYLDQVKSSEFRGREANLIKIKKVNPEVSDMNSKLGGKILDGHGTVSPVKPRVVLGRQRTEKSRAIVGTVTEVPARTKEKVSSLNHEEGRPAVSGYSDDDSSRPSPTVSHSLPKDTKPSLKLKLKNPYHERQSSWAPRGDDEKGFVKGQRSKRKRPLMEKTSAKEEKDVTQLYEDNAMDGIMEARWILEKLGKDAIGKRVEVHQPSNNSWQKGSVVEVFEGKSTLSVALDDGRTKKLDLGKQGIRFDSKKQNR